MRDDRGGTMGGIKLAAVVSGLLLLAGCARAAPASTIPTPRAPAATVTPAGQVIAAPASPTPAATAVPTTGQVRSQPPPTATPTPRPSQARPGPLVLEVSEPAADLVEVPADAQRVTVAGRSRPSAVVSVNGQLVDLDGSGAFRTEVALDEDITLVEVVASDTSGAELRVQRVVVRE